MGIVDQQLATFELSDFESCYIEHNVNGSIHLHMDGIRIELSRREFDHLVGVVTEARDALRARKDLSTETAGTETADGAWQEVVDGTY